MSPSETALITQVLISSGFLFGIAYLGNRLSFSNRFVNALITALIFAVFYAGLAYTVDQTVLPPEMKEATKDTWLQMILMAAGLVFVLDLVANFISFSNRFVSALTTAVLSQFCSVRWCIQPVGCQRRRFRLPLHPQHRLLALSQLLRLGMRRQNVRMSATLCDLRRLIWAKTLVICEVILAFAYQRSPRLLIREASTSRGHCRALAR